MDPEIVGFNLFDPHVSRRLQPLLETIPSHPMILEALVCRASLATPARSSGPSGISKWSWLIMVTTVIYGPLKWLTKLLHTTTG